jgi:methylenetetrahydrofolate dehydrogenase (NADP+)/methenyltetrahydrofolate cyclohydrolase
MAARRLNGAALARTIREELRGEVSAFQDSAGRSPALHIVLAGADPASQIYVRNKERAGAEAGLAVTVHRLEAATDVAELLGLVGRLNEDARVDGILVQAPLPPAMGRSATQDVFDAIHPAKDVDGFHPTNAGLLLQGRARLTPCTPTGIMELLARGEIPVAGQHAVVSGRSALVGKPMALLLLQGHATVTICHSRTADVPAVTRQADILVAAVGRVGFVTPAMVKP